MEREARGQPLKKPQRNGQTKEETDEDEQDVPAIVLLRRKNIARNEAVMAALSFSSVTLKAKKTPSAAEKKQRAQNKRSRVADGAQAKSAGEAGATSSHMVLRRKSRRLKGEPVDPKDGLVALPGTWLEVLDRAPGKKAGRAPYTRHDYGPELGQEEADEKIEVLKKQIDSRDDGRAGTASYEHCIHRVRTMSDAQLARRVRAIEGAHGAKAVEKMLVFTHVLKARGKTDLLALAEAALDRLARGVPMPKKES